MSEQAMIPLPETGFSVRSPEAPTGTASVPIAYDSIYNWDYRETFPELRTLYEKGKGAMWDAQTDLDWSIDVDPERESVPDSMIPIYGSRLWDKLDKKRELPKLRQLQRSWMLSNFLHGEQGALLAAAQIVSAVPDTDAKFYASTQVMDEARHVEAYDRYLREKIEMVFPINPNLRTLLDTILQESRWDLKYLGMQIMVEGLALAAFGFIVHQSTEPLLKELVTRVMQDEARHVAFGVVALKDRYKDMPTGELKDREEFIIEASRLMHDRLLSREVWEHMGMPVEECVALTLESPAQQLFRKLLFSKIVPNVKRLGLLTDNVRRGFTDLGVIQFEDHEPTA